MAKVLITGGAGFIGSNLVNYLLKNHPESSQLEIVVLDALTYAANPANLPNSTQVSLIIGDVRNQKLVEELVSSVDMVYHLAAESHVDRSIENSLIFVDTNVLGTLNILEAGRKFGKRIVLVSTDEVYGSIATGFASEDYPLNPSSPYSASKAAADLLAISYCRTYGADIIITRASNNYGPKQYPEKLIPLIISKALAREKVPVYGDGANIRDWINVDDHCQGLMLAMASGKSGEIYNFGDIEHLRNIDLVKCILAMLNISEEIIEFVPDRLGHDYRYAINSEKARTELNWVPQHDLNSSMLALIGSYQNK